jgi:hypothetical protein
MQILALCKQSLSWAATKNNAHHANCSAEAAVWRARKLWSPWSGHTSWDFLPSSVHIIRICKTKCTMKVEISYRNFTLFSIYFRLKVHIANPDSNLMAVNCAYEYWQPMWAFNDDVMVQINEFKIKWLLTQVSSPHTAAWAQCFSVITAITDLIRAHQRRWFQRAPPLPCSAWKISISAFF